jgi:hypothetical protein
MSGNKQMSKKFKALIASVIIIIAVALVGSYIYITKPYGLFQTQAAGSTITIVIVSNGSVNQISGLQVYSDSALTLPITSIAWGALSPGTSGTSIIYLKNTGNVPLTLSIATNTFVPASASTYLTLTWNRGGVLLQPQTSTPATFTLTVSNSIVGVTTFTFNIVITGTE